MTFLTKKNISFFVLLSMIATALMYSKVPTGHNCGSEAAYRICYQADLTNPNSKYCKPTSNKTWCLKMIDLPREDWRHSF